MFCVLAIKRQSVLILLRKREVDQASYEKVVVHHSFADSLMFLKISLRFHPDKETLIMLHYLLILFRQEPKVPQDLAVVYLYELKFHH